MDKLLAVAPRFLFLCTVGVFLALLMPATSLAFPIAAPGTEGYEVAVSATGPVIATYQGNSAVYSNDLYLMLDGSGNPGDDGNPANDLFLFNNHASEVGSTVNLGSFPVGTKLIFRLHVNDTGEDFLTGPASRNPDNQPHARAQASWKPNETLVSFEDLFNGPFNYNDLSFSFVPTTAAAAGPSPGWYSNSGPATICENCGGSVGYNIVWENSYIYSHPGPDNLYWYAQLLYLNAGNQVLHIRCNGAGADPAAIKENIKEHIRGTEGIPPNGDGYVAAEETFCTRDSNINVTFEPGATYYGWAIFHNVPPGGEVSLEWSPYRPSPWVDPWHSRFNAIPPTVCPPELVTLGTCQEQSLPPVPEPVPTPTPPPLPSPPPSPPACGGNIVAFTNTNYKGHNAIYVDTGPNPSHVPPITAIYFGNELVPNADNGIKYDSPIGQEGRHFIYGVSRRWTLWPPSHWNWQQNWEWRTFYNC